MSIAVLSPAGVRQVLHDRVFGHIDELWRHSVPWCVTAVEQHVVRIALEIDALLESKQIDSESYGTLRSALALAHHETLTTVLLERRRRWDTQPMVH